MLPRTEIIKLVSLREKQMESIRESNLPIVIYGAKKTADEAIEWLLANGIYPDACMVDQQFMPQKNPVKIYMRTSTEKITLPIYSSESIGTIYPSFIQVLGCWIPENPFKRKHPSASQLFIPPIEICPGKSAISEDFLLDRYEEFQKSENLLECNGSKDLFECYLKAHISKDFRSLHDWKTTPAYFGKKLLRFNDEEVVLDCGAYNGDTLLEFNTIVQGKFNSYYAFEPDPVNFENLKENLLSNFSSDKRIYLYSYGVSEYDMSMSFSSTAGGLGSNIDEKGNIQVQVKSLDSMNFPTAVTFIKMDIEGAELSALKGAANLIRKHKPKLAICVYHRKTDLISIPQYLKELVPEYNINLGYHSNAYSDLILYASTEK